MRAIRRAFVRHGAFLHLAKLAWILAIPFASAGIGFSETAKEPELQVVLQSPIKLDELHVWRDGGSLGFQLSDDHDHQIVFCVDGRVKSNTAGYFFLNDIYPQRGNAERIALDGDVERRLISYLNSWLESKFDQKRLATISKAKEVSKLTADEFKAWHVLHLVENRARFIQSTKASAKDGDK